MQHLIPNLRHIPGKKVILGDNLAAHLNLNVLKACKENNISFVFLVANSTHLLEPLDVCFFAPLKNGGTPLCFHFLIKKTLQGSEFKHIEAWNLIKGFSTTGIYPICRDKVLSKLRPFVQTINTEGNLPEVIGENFRDYLESVRSQLVVAPTKGRRFHLPVQPGKSVSFEEVQMYVQNRELDQAKKEAKKNQAKPKKFSVNKCKRIKKKEESETSEEKFFVEDTELEDVPSENSLEQLKENDHIIVQYEGSYYPGQISGFDIINGDIKVLVSAKTINGKNWRWPENGKKDEIYYDEKDVIKKINPPCVVPVNTRVDFKIDDDTSNEKWCNPYDDFLNKNGVTLCNRRQYAYISNFLYFHICIFTFLIKPFQLEYWFVF